MAVSRDEQQVVLQDKCCNPQVIVGNRSAGSFELNEKTRIVFCGLPAGKQHAHRRLGEQPIQQDLIPALLRAPMKAGLDFTENYEWNPDFFTGSQPIRQAGIATKQIGKPIGVEGDSHVHFFGSICR